MPSSADSTQPFCVALGVTGSIAAYKAAELASRLAKGGIDVCVVMTPNAARLVQPLTFQTLTRNPVLVDLWEQPDWRPEHVALADRADLLLIAPASADILAKLAHGIADDALSTLALAHDGPVLVAPAMNPRMWRNPAVCENCERLRARGVRFLGPDSGDVACGPAGEGRMIDPERITSATQAHLDRLRTSQPVPAPGPGGTPGRVLVTAGATCEDLDPVRFLSNRSSGRMGYALAEVAAAAGWDVTLVSAPVDLPPPVGCELRNVRSAAEMFDAVREVFPACRALAMAAAVADYRPARAATNKIAKADGLLEQVQFTRTDDILDWVAQNRRVDQAVLGFAAETDREALERRAAEKRDRKRLDWIAVNDVSRADVGFQAQQNEMLLLGPEGARLDIPKQHKLAVASRLLAALLSP